MHSELAGWNERNSKARRRALVSEISRFLVALVVIFFVWYTAYNARKDLVNAERAGCEQTNADRIANARGWRNAQSIWTVKGEMTTAELYRKIAEELEERGGGNCAERFPVPGLFGD